MFREEEEIKQDMLDNISNTLDKSQNSMIHDALSAAALEFVNMHMELDYVESKFNVNNLEGEELERFINQRTAIERRKATYATTKVVITGEEGTKIEKGSLVSAGDVEFEVLEDCVVGESGRCTVEVRATEKGSVGNVSEDSIVDLPVSIPGVIDLYNPEPVTNGYDEETDKELRERYYHKLKRPGKAGNKYHYEEWALEVEGVGGVKVFPLWEGPLTVKVLIIDQDKQPANSDLIDRTREYIVDQAPFGADITVDSAEGVDVDIAVKLTLEDGYSEEEVLENIEDNIVEYLKEIAFWQSTISYAIIGSLIIDSEGVVDYTDLKINGGYENINISEEEVAVLGGVINE